MIRAQDVCVYPSGRYTGNKSFAYKYVIDSPTDIAVPRTAPRSPPAVVPLALVKFSERIYEPAGNHLVYSFPFLLSETMLAFIFFWIGEVLHSMRYIEIAAEDDWLVLFQFFAVGKESRVPMIMSHGQAG